MAREITELKEGVIPDVAKHSSTILLSAAPLVVAGVEEAKKDKAEAKERDERLAKTEKELLEAKTQVEKLTKELAEKNAQLGLVKESVDYRKEAETERRYEPWCEV